MQKRLVGLMLITLAAAFCIPSSMAHAKVGGLSIGPFLQEVSISEGQPESSFLITITNSTAVELPMRISVVDFGAADDKGTVNFLPSTDSLERKYGLASWMRLEKDTIVLGPRSSQRVKVTIENRESLSPGGHYGAVVFQVDNKLEAREIQPKVDFTKAVSTLVLAKKLGGEKHSLTLSSHTMSGPPFFFPDKINLKFLNNGNIHTSPVGEITIADPFGYVVSQATVNPDATIILPETFRTYPTKLQTKGISWIPGLATVTIRYRDPATNAYVTDVSRVFIVPPQAIGLTVTIILALFILLRYHRQIRKRIIKLAHSVKRHVKKIHKKH